MNLSSTQRHELQDLGWSVVYRKAQRPEAIQASNVLFVGEDLTFDEQDGNPLARLYNHR